MLKFSTPNYITNVKSPPWLGEKQAIGVAGCPTATAEKHRSEQRFTVGHRRPKKSKKQYDEGFFSWRKSSTVVSMTKWEETNIANSKHKEELHSSETSKVLQESIS